MRATERMTYEAEQQVVKALRSLPWYMFLVPPANRNDESKSLQLVLPGSFRINKDRCTGCVIARRRRTISGETRG